MSDAEDLSEGLRPIRVVGDGFELIGGDVPMRDDPRLPALILVLLKTPSGDLRTPAVGPVRVDATVYDGGDGYAALRRAHAFREEVRVSLAWSRPWVGRAIELPGLLVRVGLTVINPKRGIVPASDYGSTIVVGKAWRGAARRAARTPP